MSGSNSISDAELSNITVLRERFHSLEHNRFRELAHAILRPEVLADFRESGVDEVEIVRHMLALSDMTDVWKEASASEAERAKNAPRAPRFNPRGSPREELHALSESIGIGAALPPASVEVLVRIIETQREHYENEIANLRYDFKSLWDTLFDDLAASPATAYYIFFVTQGEQTTKRYKEMAFFYARAFKARIYRNYHFLSVWTYAAGALKELKGLGYTTRSAERDLIRSSQIRTLILQLRGVMMTELCQDLSKYISRALAASPLYGPYFDVEWDGSTVMNEGRYMEEVKVTLRTDAFKRALPGLEASLLRLCDPSNIWESPESFRVIYGYLKGGSNIKYGVTEHLSVLLSEYATLVNFMDQLLRPIKAPAVAAAFAKMHPTTLSRPAWDYSWTGLLYGGDPIARTNLTRHMTLWLLSPPADEDELVISQLWNVIEKAYLTKTATSINEYWEVESIVSKSPRWHHIPSADSGTPTPFIYVPPLVSEPSERSTSSHSFLQSNAALSSSTKLKSRPHAATSDAEIRITPALAPQSTHPVYELPARQLKVMQNLLRENARDQRGKISWKDLCKAFTALGFNIDDTTPGSAVTFIPPNANDRPISIHRPHPEPNLVPLKVRQLAIRLGRVYGWSSAWFQESRQTLQS